jgi:hypothetical protein
MREWWSGLSVRHKVVIALVAVVLSLLAAFWMTASGVGDPNLCYEGTEPGGSETCPPSSEPLPEGG